MTYSLRPEIYGGPMIFFLIFGEIRKVARTNRPILQGDLCWCAHYGKMLKFRKSPFFGTRTPYFAAFKLKERRKKIQSPWEDRAVGNSFHSKRPDHWRRRKNIFLGKIMKETYPFLSLQNRETIWRIGFWNCLQNDNEGYSCAKTKMLRWAYPGLSTGTLYWHSQGRLLSRYALKITAIHEESPEKLWSIKILRPPESAELQSNHIFAALECEFLELIFKKQITRIQVQYFPHNPSEDLHKPNTLHHIPLTFYNVAYIDIRGWAAKEKQHACVPRSNDSIWIILGGEKDQG